MGSWPSDWKAPIPYQSTQVQSGSTLLTLPSWQCTLCEAAGFGSSDWALATHMVGPGLCLLALAQAQPHHCRHLGSESQDRSTLPFPLSLSLKQTKTCQKTCQNKTKQSWALRTAKAGPSRLYSYSKYTGALFTIEKRQKPQKRWKQQKSPWQIKG